MAQQNIPKLRFPEFGGEWENKKLGEVTKYTKGFAFKSSDYRDNGIRVVRVSDLNSDTVKTDNEKVFIAKTSADKYKNYRILNGDIIITTVGSKPDMIESAVGRGIFVNEDNVGLLNQNMLKFDKITNINNRFLLGYINSKRYKNFIKDIARGNANQSNITVKDLLDYNLSIATLPEQQKIASFLTAVDKKIEQLQKKKELLEQYKKGMMQKLFSQEIRFKDDKGEDFPEWEVKKLGEITYKVDKTNKSREKLPIYSINNIKGFIPQSEQFDKIDSNDRGFDISLYKIVENNTFAYNPARINVGSIGYSGLLSRIIVSSLYVCFKTKESVNDIFFNFFLQTDHFNNSVLSKGEGGVRIYLFYENFAQITIDIPPFKEQIKIANFLTAIDNKIALTNKELKGAKTFKKGLLQQMFV